MESQIIDDFRIEMLAAHNSCRELHGVPHLILHEELNEQSQDCAQDLIDAVHIESSRYPDVGENICVMHVTDANFVPKGHSLVKDWYSQRNVVQFGGEPKDNTSVNFSQLVWRSTRLLGVGMARNTAKIVVVCQYSPPGNVLGEYEHNVPAPLANPTSEVMLQQLRSEEAMEMHQEGMAISTDDFNKEILAHHNTYRAKHHAPPLQLDANQCKVAAEHAKHLMKTRKLEHSKQHQYGENIFMAMNSDREELMKDAAKDACNEWYNEIKSHKFGVEPKDTSAGHFSQMVWKDTQLLGAGFAMNERTGEVYVVCNYSPPGNILGQFASNVLKA